MIINIKLLKTIIFFVVIIYVVVHVNKNFFSVYGEIQKNTKDILTDYSKYFFLYIPIMFWIASCAKYFYHSDGIFELYIKRAINSKNSIKDYYHSTSYFPGGISILAIYIFSLLCVASEAGVADEGVIIYTSISMLVYFYFKLKNIFNLNDVNIDFMIYLGFALGLLVVYGSKISTFTYLIESMLINKDINFFSNIGIFLFTIPLVSYFVGEKETLLEIQKLNFHVKNYGYILIFSILMGIISFLFFNTVILLFNYIKNSKYNNFIVLIFGFFLAFIIKKMGFLTFGMGERAIEEAFANVLNREKVKKLQKENNKEELAKLKKLEQEGKFNINPIFNFNNVFARIINCIMTVGSGLTSGLIIPAMTVGCGIGSVFHKYTNMPEQNLMYLGMIALLTNAVHAPVTSAVIVNRISNQPYNNLPVSITVSFISYLTYNFINKKIKV